MIPANHSADLLAGPPIFCHAFGERLSGRDQMWQPAFASQTLPGYPHFEAYRFHDLLAG